MGNQLLASKIVSYETTPKVRNFPTLATAVLAVQGVAERGPVGVPTLCTSWDDYVRVFGGFTVNGDLATVVWCIYMNDAGARVWVQRVVHYTDLTDPATKTSVAATVNIPSTTAVASAGAVTSGNAGPFNLEPAQTLIIHCDEDGSGPDTCTFDAARAVAAGSGLSIVDITSETLILSIDGGDSQTITFAGTESTAQDVVTTINASLLGGVAVVNTGEVDIMGSIRGTDGEVDITGGTALAEIGHSIGTDNGTGDVANINAVTFTEAKTVIENDVVNPVTGVTVTEESGGEITITSDTTGAGSSVQVEVASTATGFGFDNSLHSGSAESSATTIQVDGKYDGTYAHDLRVKIEAASNGESDYFNWVTTDDSGVVLENFPNLQVTDDTATDHVDAVINDSNTGSLYFTATDQATTDRPDNDTYTPASGDDGLTSLVDADWIGNSAGPTGLYTFNTVLDVTLFLDGGRATSAWQNGLITYCEVTRSGKMFAILDPPDGYTYTQMVTYVKTTAALKELTEYAAIFWPRPKIVNPSSVVFGTDANITVPTSGIIGGLISRVDNSRPGGVYIPPAGVEYGRMFGVVGFSDDAVLDEGVRDVIYPERINPITTLSGFPRFMDGNWTLKESGQFPTISERRGVIHIERTVEQGLQFARHQNNDAELRGAAQRSVDNYLITQMKLGAFRTKDPATAFFADFSEAINTPAVINAYQLKGRIGLATQKSAEWVILEFSQDTRRLEEELSV